LKKNPALAALIRSLGERRLFGDPYRTVIGQYKSIGDSLTSSAEFFNAAPSAIDIFGHFTATYILPFIAPHSLFLTKDYDDKVLNYQRILVPKLGLVASGILVVSGILCPVILCPELIIGYGAYQYFKARKNRKLLSEREALINEVRAIADSSVETILKELLKDISNHLCQTLCEQLNNISDDIRKRKAKLSEQNETDEARKIAEFLKKTLHTSFDFI
jgi:hypothetical protein